MPRTTMTPEGRVKIQVRKCLENHNIFYFMPVAIGGMGKAGIPDFICCFNGCFLTIETKATSKGRLTALQIRRAEEIREVGGCALLVHGEHDFDELDQLLAHVGQDGNFSWLKPFYVPEATA